MCSSDLSGFSPKIRFGLRHNKNWPQSWDRFRHLQPLSTKYNTASTNSSFSHLLLFPARGNSGSMSAHWRSLKSLAYRSFIFLYHMLIILLFSLLVQHLITALDSPLYSFYYCLLYIHCSKLSKHFTQSEKISID